MNPTGPTESTNEVPTGTRMIGAGWGDYSEVGTASASSLIGTGRLMLYEQRHGRSLSLVFGPGRRGCDCHEAHGSWNSHNYLKEYVFFFACEQAERAAQHVRVTRYSTVGTWSGKAKVVNNKIQFLLRASAQLHNNDNLDLNTFTALLKDRIKIFLPAK